MDIMEIITITDHIMDQNAYLYFDADTKQGALIDPGTGGNHKSILNAVEKHGIIVEIILLTHGHFDHAKNAHNIKQALNIPLICAHTDETHVLADQSMNCSALFGSPFTSTADKLLSHGDVIEVGRGKLTVIHTPGHTSGSVCFYDVENKWLFSGDTLFRNTVGRTDFPTGNNAALIHSIRESLFKLPDDVTVYPGHQSHTSIGHEKRHNPVAFVLNV